MYYKLPIKDRMDLMKSYKKANPKMSYSDMVNDYNTSYQRFNNGGKVEFNSGGETHVVYKKESPTGNGKGIEGHIMVNHPTKDKGKWDTIDLTEITNYDVKTVKQGVASTKQWHAENPEYAYGGIHQFSDGGKKDNTNVVLNNGLPVKSIETLKQENLKEIADKNKKDVYLNSLRKELDVIQNQALKTSNIFDQLKMRNRSGEIFKELGQNKPELVKKEIDNGQKAGKIIIASSKYLFPPIAPLTNTIEGGLSVYDYVKNPNTHNTASLMTEAAPFINNKYGKAYQIMGDYLTGQEVGLFPEDKHKYGGIQRFDDGGILKELPIEETVPDPLTEISVPKPLSKKQIYQDAIKNNYSKYIESVHNITPYAESTSKEHMNCIHGVCTVLEGTGAKKFKESYTGNMTFADNAKKEGYYKANPNKEGFEIGDIIQYARTKANAASIGRFNPENSLNSLNAEELVPQHAKVILGKYVDDQGVTRYKVGHNAGKDKWILSKDPEDETKDVSETTLLKHFNEGNANYDGLIINRYDPDYIQKNEEENKIEIDAIKGKNKYANFYKGQPKIDTIKKETYDEYGKPTIKEYTEAKPLVDFYKKNYEKIGKSADMPPETLNKLFHNQVGIAAKETEFDNPLTKRAIGKALIPDWALTGARKVAGMIGDDSTWVDDYWKKNADGVQGKYNNVDEFKKHLSEDSKLSKEAREYLYYNSPKSKGMFQQKELSKRGRVLGSNFRTPENQFVSSMYLAIDNYHLLKKKYPDLSDDQLVDLTTLMHNAPSKALTPEFVNYYLKNNDIEYVNDVKNKRGIVNQPDKLVKKIQKIQDEKSLNKISPQQSINIMDWAKNLPKKPVEETDIKGKIARLNSIKNK